MKRPFSSPTFSERRIAGWQDAVITPTDHLHMQRGGAAVKLEIIVLRTVLGTNTAIPPYLSHAVNSYLLALVVYLRRTNSCTKALASRPPVLMRVLEKTNPGPRLLGG